MRLSSEVKKVKKKLLSCSCIIIIFFCLILVLSGCIFLPQEEEALAPPIQKPPQVTYHTVTAKRGALERKLRVVGHYRLMETVDLSFTEKEGRIKRIHKKIGEVVKDGDTIIELESSVFMEDIDRARIVMQKAELELRNAQRSKEDELALAAFELAELNHRLKIIQNLPDTYPSSEIADTKSQIQRKEINIASLNNKWEYHLERAELDLEEARLHLHIKEAELDKTRLTSPISGEVTFLTRLKIGDFAERDTTLATISSPSQKLIQVRGNEAFQFVKGMEVLITVNNQQYPGEVVMSVGDVPDNAPANQKNAAYFRVHGEIQGVSEGTAAEIEVIFERRDDVIILPVNCLRTRSGQTYVIVLKDNIRYDRNVEVGMRLPAEAEIISGLEEGEIVVVR